MKKTLRLILGDQLNPKHSWYKEPNENIVYVLMEMKQETEYVVHHIQKICAFFLAMRSFANDLTQEGKCVHYLKIGDATNNHELNKNLDVLIEKYGIEKFEYQLPDEYRLDIQLKEYCKSLKIEYQSFDSEHFLSNRDEVGILFKNKKTYLLETFYRHLRKKHQVLMTETNEPIGGKWNYDAENRKKYNYEYEIPIPLEFNNDCEVILNEIQQAGIKYIGKKPKDNLLQQPINYDQALQQLTWFINKALPHFGDYQDALVYKEPLMFHSRISFALNTKIIHPKEVIEAVETAYYTNKLISISQAEGFIRQVLGWREYVRGIYWAKMPNYSTLNYLEHNGKLPDWYWTGDTKMTCLEQAINQSLDLSYAHHIQRLMITGNFANLMGADPNEVDLWYLGIYIDAIEWVEITNTRGMSLFADGGIVGTKPYVSSGNYINNMSNYCKNCIYDVKKKVGEKSCPFNSLYWDFLDRHKEKLTKNPRMGNMYNTWKRFSDEEKDAILSQADYYKKHINSL